MARKWGWKKRVEKSPRGRASASYSGVKERRKKKVPTKWVWRKKKIRKHENFFSCSKIRRKKKLRRKKWFRLNDLMLPFKHFPFSVNHVLSTGFFVFDELIFQISVGCDWIYNGYPIDLKIIFSGRAVQSSRS